MKRLISAAFAVVCITASCGSSENNMEAMTAMRDSVFAAYPDVASVVLNVNGSSDLQIAVGSKSLYAASDADRKMRATELSAMAQRIFGPQTHLRSGRLLITQDESNQLPEPQGAVIEKLEFKEGQ